MNTNTPALSKDTQVDINDQEQVRQVALQLYEALGFSVMDCMLALHSSKGHVGAAAEYLASGKWMGAKLISWNWNSLHEKCAKLTSLTGLPDQLCLGVLKNCAGNLELAQRKLACLPALP
jgi:hypothetical protein